MHNLQAVILLDSGDLAINPSGLVAVRSLEPEMEQKVFKDKKLICTSKMTCWNWEGTPEMRLYIINSKSALKFVFQILSFVPLRKISVEMLIHPCHGCHKGVVFFLRRQLNYVFFSWGFFLKEKHRPVAFWGKKKTSLRIWERHFCFLS